jgi:hypothetical protein
MTYLEDAAALLYKARDDNEKRAVTAEEMLPGMRVTALPVLAEVNGRRVELAAGFTRLAAIQAGLPPCLGHALTGEET